MNAILGMLQLLNTTALDRRQDDYVDKAKGAARSLLGLLNDILDFSKVEAGKMQLAPEPFDLDNVLEDLSVILSSNLSGKEVDLVYDIDPAIPRQLIGDSLRIKQVLINLGGNAVKFTQQGEVVVRAVLLARTPERIRLQIAVADSGIGIAPENQARIFQAFTQAEANTTRRFGGTGLGLVISTRLIRLMGGELELVSSPGRGSTFSFTLDLPAAALAGDPNVPQPAAQVVQALLVDDNPLACAAHAQMLRGMGWDVHTTGSAREALDWLQARRDAGVAPPDVVYADSRMPVMNGRETVAAARLLYRDHAAPKFILLTGDNREVLEVRSAAPGDMPDGVAVRPLTAAMFAHALELAHSSPLNATEGTVASGTLSANQAPLTGMRVLLVEDNPINQQVALELLATQGALVTLAEDGLQGVKAIRAANPAFDAVLMDLQMPVMDGLTAARHLREDPQLAALPIIAMTANVMDTDRAECRAAGMNDHVGKPFDVKHLVDVLVRNTGWQLPGTVASVASGVPAEEGAALVALEPPLPDWPQGLDIDTALARMGGNRGLLQRTLVAFVTDARQLHARVTAMLREGALADARRELHAFKGLAATLGAMELSRLAQTAEKAVMDSPATRMEALLAELVGALEALLPALDKVASDLAGADVLRATATAASGEDAELAAGLRDLLKALQASDMEAMVLHADLRQKVNADLAQDMEPLDLAMSELELDVAAVECDKLLQRLTTR